MRRGTEICAVDWVHTAVGTAELLHARVEYAGKSALRHVQSGSLERVAAASAGVATTYVSTCAHHQGLHLGDLTSSSAAAASCREKYEVVMVSPRNYFLVSSSS
jgi:hypothetical protein